MDTLKVNARDFSIKAKHLRKQGLVPGAVFGGPLKESVSLQMEEAAVKKMLTEKRLGSRLDIELNGETIPVQLKEVQKDPLTNTVLDISFQALKRGEKINSVFQVILENVDKVTTALVEKMTTEIPYRSLPRDMIDTITIDVNGMPVGTVVTVADLEELKDGKVEPQVPADEIIFRIVEKKIIVDDEEDADGEAAAE